MLTNKKNNNLFHVLYSFFSHFFVPLGNEHYLNSPEITTFNIWLIESLLFFFGGEGEVVVGGQEREMQVARRTASPAPYLPQSSWERIPQDRGADSVIIL